MAHQLAAQPIDIFSYMPLPFSKSQVEKLGERLIASAPPDQADVDQLHELLLAYDTALTQCVAVVRTGLGLEATPRLKNTGTIIEKLNRHGGSWLKSIQDLAGMRIVRDFNRTAQDELVGQIVELFSGDPRPSKVVDRRRQPSNGYRAVHVVVYRDGMPVEIQVRTRWQHTWADLFEKLADRFGRNIRYGEPPEYWWNDEQLNERPKVLVELSLVEYKKRCLMVETALTIGDLISMLEHAEASGSTECLGHGIEAIRVRAEQELALLREDLEGYGLISKGLGGVKP